MTDRDHRIDRHKQLRSWKDASVLPFLSRFSLIHIFVASLKWSCGLTSFCLFFSQVREDSSVRMSTCHEPPVRLPAGISTAPLKTILTEADIRGRVTCENNMVKVVQSNGKLGKLY